MYYLELIDLYKGMLIFMDSETIKTMVMELGADLCGIADMERFDDAPEGHNPVDIYFDCKSVIVFAKRVPSGSLNADNCVPYSHMSDVVTREVDRLEVELCLILEDLGIGSVPIPSDDPSIYWEADNLYARGILSLRHAGFFAGLGIIGKNTLLINEQYGNMIQIGAVLVDIKLKGDPIADYEGCIADCDLCITSCPQKALNGKTVNQKLCRPLSNFKTERGYILKKCNLCRRKCPNILGLNP